MYSVTCSFINSLSLQEEWNPIQYAAAISDLNWIETLLNNKTEVNHLNSSKVVPQVTPLMISIRFSNIDAIKLLLPHSNLDFQDQYGYTAVHYAVLTRNPEVITLLIAHGASVNVKTNINKTSPLDMAKQLKYDDIAALIESKLVLETDPKLPNFKSWLTALGASEYLTRFMNAGYDIEFIQKHGLNEEDLNCIGIPMSKLGLRRKLIALHRLEEFEEEEEENLDDEEDEGSEEYEESENSEEYESEDVED